LFISTSPFHSDSSLSPSNHTGLSPPCLLILQTSTKILPLLLAAGEASTSGTVVAYGQPHGSPSQSHAGGVAGAACDRQAGSTPCGQPRTATSGGVRSRRRVRPNTAVPTPAGGQQGAHMGPQRAVELAALRVWLAETRLEMGG
jgi:hypothetical protein